MVYKKCLHPQKGNRLIKFFRKGDATYADSIGNQIANNSSVLIVIVARTATATTAIVIIFITVIIPKVVIIRV